MKKHIKYLTLLSSLSLILSGCNSSSNNEDDNKINPGDKEETTYTYSDKITYDGYITSAISFDILSNIGIDLDIFSSYVTFTYQTVNETLSSNDYYKAIKFHLNLDLYSIEETYESSLITSSLLPLISDFKYATILENVSDLDVYYLADGYLYTTISKFKDDTLPLRNDRTLLASYEREIIGTNRFDITSILDMLKGSEDSSSSSLSSINITDILSQVGSYLEGFNINLGDLNNVINGTNITFLSDGFKVYFDEIGLTGFSTIFNNIINFALNKFDIGIEIDNLIDINDITLELSSSNFIFQIEDKNALKPLIDISFKRNDSKSLSIEPPYNLEEDYLIQSKIINKVDALYELYNNYEISSSFNKKIEKAIKEINNLSEDELKRVSSLNTYLGYSLMNMDKNGNYVSLKEKENIESLYNELKEAINSTLTNDYSYLKAYEVFDNVYTSKYSSSTISNLIKKLEDENSEKYNEFISKMSSYLSSFLAKYYENIEDALTVYSSNEDTSLEAKQDVIKTIYENSVFEKIELNDGTKTYLSNINSLSKVKNLSSEIILKMIKYFNVSNPLDNTEFANKVYNFILDYFDELSIAINKLSNKDLKEYNTYSSYLLINDNDDIYSIFDLIGASLTSLKTSIKRKDNSLISSILYRVNKFAKSRIDEVLTLDQINYLLTEEIITSKEEKLDSIYNMLNVYISSSLFKKYESSLTYIDLYYSLKEGLNNQKTNLGL